MPVEHTGFVIATSVVTFLFGIGLGYGFGKISAAVDLLEVMCSAVINLNRLIFTIKNPDLAGALTPRQIAAELDNVVACLQSPIRLNADVTFKSHAEGGGTKYDPS